jgi:hypothetical protein
MLDYTTMSNSSHGSATPKMLRAWRRRRLPRFRAAGGRRVRVTRWHPNPAPPTGAVNALVSVP